MVRKRLDYHFIAQKISELPEYENDSIVIDSNDNIGLNDQVGKSALAKAMAAPIRRSLDYQGIARRALVVDPLPEGAMPTYDRDIDISAVITKCEEDAASKRVFGDRVTVPEFEIFSNPTVHIADVKRRRFNIIDRTGQESEQYIWPQED
jgi:hypothetical protein